MSRILFISLQVSEAASKGHLNPLIGVVQHVHLAGHEAGWLSLPRAMGSADAEQVRAASAVVLGSPELPAGVIRTALELSQLAVDPARAWEAYQSFLLDPLPHLVEPVCDIVREFAPQAIAVDCMSYAGILAAHRLGIPYVGVCAGLKILKSGPFLPAYMHDLRPLLPLREGLFRRYGLTAEFRLLECLSPFANVVFATRTLVGDIALPPRTHLVGPSIPPGRRGDEPSFPWDRLLPDKPMVYAAFGSVHTKAGLLDIVTPLCEAADRAGAQLVLSSEALSARDRQGAMPTRAGLAAEPGSRGAWARHAGDVVVVPYAPQLQLLERVDAFVTHGGANSVMEAMYAGTPLIIVPLSGDQPWQAKFVEERRVGIRLDRDRFDTNRCTAALQQLLPEASEFRANARQVRESYRKQDGAKEAANLIMNLAKSKNE
jgi:UDP:flavonoid glycosyltransferase YjiC (YdhE family)